MFNNSIHKSTIVGIQFGLLSPEEIRKGSVAEITSRDTYAQNKPVIGGLFDPRMGVIESGLICPTDGLNYMSTPGYSGHLELAKPVFYVQYLATILKVLRCVCFKCSKLLINKKNYCQAIDLKGEARWKYVFSLCQKIKRCGEDTDDGCGCKQPSKIKKSGMATITAEWVERENTDGVIIPITPEIALKILKRISDEDVSFMGFSPIYSRPDWMICQVLQISPPAVRPSVKHDAMQHSEDDLTHILVNIVKMNKMLQEKIQNNAPEKIIQQLSDVLQFYITAMVDNKIPGATLTASQRSNRPLKSIKDRLNGKGGRMRGNLMAKRVDFSARSVITADPSISISKLGIPMKVAKNLTKPVRVNKMNMSFLKELVKNGPDVWPGAKLIDKKNGDTITLKYYLDRESIVLEEGDVVHRQMMDGDPIIFNRQPTLHRMSMMCHISKIMHRGDTFRMNVADTKPYNADFDGDEMNLHMPQDLESESELLNLAAVPYHIISPANNSSIIGIYQDSMLGSYLFSKEGVKFSPQQAMDILMMFNGVNEVQLNAAIEKNQGHLTNYDILSQIMPPLSIKGKVEINNGSYIRGQMDKGVLGGRSRGLLQRICNDFGNMSSAKFIDDLQNVITEYMKHSGFSVGISDLISNTQTNEQIIKVINEKKNDVKNLIHQVQIGVFENNTGKTNEEEFETQVNSILNQASSESGKIGLKNLSQNNRFVQMVNAGSKGSDLNISFMISCLGQQNVDGKRIPYGFEHRTLPYYTKYDDSPGARGFVENSYINGLTPQELFQHAMGGRVGLIDTAVKTSSTGYIQRRLIKGLEDLKVEYDMTVRNNQNKIVQFSYGEDSINTTKVEEQELPIVEMNNQDIYNHYMYPDEGIKSLNNLFLKNVMTKFKKQKEEYNTAIIKVVNKMIHYRSELVKHVFKNKSDKMVACPVSFVHIINNVQGQCGINSTSLVDITLLDAFQMIDACFKQLSVQYFVKPTLLFEILYYYYLSPKHLLVIKRFNKSSLTLLLENITLYYKKAIVSPGEMVGMIAGQSIGEVSTQMTLNTFHYAGVASKSNVTRGVPRIEEILSLSSEIKNPSLSIYLKPDDERQKDKARDIMYMLEHTRLEEVVKCVEICFDPDDLNTLIELDKDCISQYKAFEDMITECAGCEDAFTQQNDLAEKSKWVLRLAMDPEAMLEKNITMDDVHFTLKHSYGDMISCIYTDFNSDKLLFRIRMISVFQKNEKKKKTHQPLDESDNIYILKKFQQELLQNVVLRGIEGIHKAILRKIVDNVVEINGVYKKQDIWVIDTIGSNLIDVLGLNYIDTTRTTSNDIIEIYNVLGIEAARQAICNELVEVVEFDGTYINYHNYSVLVDRMTFTHKLISIFRHGINNDNIGPIAKASFEETPEMFLKAARHAELDTLRGISANVMCGQEGHFGTAAFQVLLDIETMKKLTASSEYTFINEEEEINRALGEYKEDACSLDTIRIKNNANLIPAVSIGEENDYNPGF